MDTIKGFNWLNYYGGKYSTSQKRGVFMDQALDILPADYWRYYLMANAPEGADVSFTWEHFASVVNKDLADVLGNFCNRILKFARSRFEGQVPDGGAPGDNEAELQKELETRIKAYTEFLEDLQYRKAFGELRAIWAAGNEYLTKAAPWAVFKEDKDAAAVGVRTGINLIRLFAVLSAPVIPNTSATIRAALGIDGDDLVWPSDDIAAELAVLTPARRSRCRMYSSARSKTTTWRPGSSVSAVRRSRGRRRRKNPFPIVIARRISRDDAIQDVLLGARGPAAHPGNPALSGGRR